MDIEQPELYTTISHQQGTTRDVLGTLRQSGLATVSDHCAADRSSDFQRFGTPTIPIT